MKLKPIALAGCAFVALGAMGTPALAAHRHHHHHYSAISKEDAQEAKTTRDLNAQQAQNPGSTPSSQSAASENGQNQDQMAANSNSSGDQNANNNSSALGHAAAQTGNEIDKAVGPKEPVTNAEMRGAVAASEVEDPAKTLATAELKTQRGEAVGAVKAVEINPDGTAKAVKADVGGFLGMGEREVNIDANNLRYIKDRNILVTDMTKPQIQNLPPVNENNNQNNNKNTTY